MSRSARAPFGALFIALFISAAPVMADPPEGEAAVANDPVELTGPIAPPWETHVGEREAGEREPPPAPPSSESKALGVPNGILNARPVDTTDATASGSPLAALDPRRSELTRVLGALAVVLGLLLLLRVFLRRASGGIVRAGRPSGVLEILARYPVARGQSLLVLKMARRILLIHQNGSSMTTLSELTDPDEVAALLARMEAGSTSRNAGKFRTVLRGFQSEHERLAAQASPRLAPAERDAPEIIDLTRSQMKGLGGLLGRRRISA